jgi:dolichol-phosphate mannosyltransferase
MTTITVVLPAYNEGDAFASGLVTLRDYFSLHRSCGYDFRYVIVDDGSTDDTYAAAQAFARWQDDVCVLRHPRNRGLGAALRTLGGHL